MQRAYLEVGSVCCLTLFGHLLPLSYSKSEHAVVVLVAVQGDPRLLQLLHLLLDEHIESRWPPLCLGLLGFDGCCNMVSSPEHAVWHFACGLERMDGVAQVTEKLVKLACAEAHQVCCLRFSHIA